MWGFDIIVLVNVIVELSSDDCLYQIVYTGNSSSRRLRLLDVAMDGAGVRSAKDV